MNYFFLLKLISELLDGTPTKDQIECVKKIVKEMIESPKREMEQSDKENLEFLHQYNKGTILLDDEAQQARRELQ